MDGEDNRHTVIEWEIFGCLVCDMPECRSMRGMKVTGDGPYPPLKAFFMPGMNSNAAVTSRGYIFKIMLTVVWYEKDRFKKIIRTSKEFTC